MELKSPVLYFWKILVIILRDILFFPVWWYTIGFWHFLVWLKNILINLQQNLSFLVWLKNIFVPMYGQRDWQGIIISFLVRIVQVIVRGFALILAVLICGLAVLLWLLLPLILIREILWQLSLVI